MNEKKLMSGTAAHQMAFEFALWAQTLPHPLHVEVIQERYPHWSRATAYRWRAAWAAANGLVYPPSSPPINNRHQPRDSAATVAATSESSK